MYIFKGMENRYKKMTPEFLEFVQNFQYNFIRACHATGEFKEEYEIQSRQVAALAVTLYELTTKEPAFMVVKED